MTIIDLAGSFLIGLGLLVTVLLWIPGVVNRSRLQELLGSRYPAVYVIYAANGPFLLLLGLTLVFLL